MCNKDKWLTLKKKKKATFSEVTQIKTPLGFSAAMQLCVWMMSHGCLCREKFTGQKWKRPIGVRSSSFRLPARGSTPAMSSARLDTPGPAKVISDENMMRQQFYLSSSLPPFNLTSPALCWHGGTSPGFLITGGSTDLIDRCPNQDVSYGNCVLPPAGRDCQVLGV